MKRNRRGVLLASALLWSAFLAGCTQSDGEEEIVAPQDNANTVTVETTVNQLSNDYYPALIVDGKYQPSKNRGVSLSLNSSVNMKDFESGLLDIAKTVFPTDEHYFQEGQIIDAETAAKWLGRASKDNPEGLNPEDNGETDPEKRHPIYLAQILEQNFVVRQEEGYELGGVTIGLAMNTVDYYSVDNEDGTRNLYQQPLDETEVLEAGRQYADAVVSRLRKTPELEGVPIAVGIFLQSAQNDLAGGTYELEGIAREGNSVEEWRERNEEKVIFPNASNEGNEDNTNFDNFKTEVQSFFPNLNGVTGVGHYRNGELLSLDIDIMTQFYGVSEIVAFAQHVTDSASRYLPQNVQVEIEIQSIAGMEAFLTRPQNSETFNYHVFD